MRICKTLDYIVHTDLHLYLFSKFDYAKSKGIRIRIELTEPITNLPIDSDKYTQLVGVALDEAFETITQSSEKQLLFSMFYKYEELYFIIAYPVYGKSNVTQCIVVKFDK